jgi:hypothetical protein
MKERILSFFLADRTFSGGVKLYQEIGSRLSLKKSLNALPYSLYLEGVLFDQLREMGDISSSDFARIMSQPVTPLLENKAAPQIATPAATSREKNKKVKPAKKGPQMPRAEKGASKK